MTDLRFEDLYLGSTFNRVIAEREGVSLTTQAYDAKGHRLVHNTSFQFLTTEDARILAYELLNQAAIVEKNQ